MLDFKKLVLEALSSSALSAFYKDTGELTKLRTFLEKKFNINTWPDSNSLFPILHDTMIRTRAESLIRFADIFPLLDFIWYFVIKNPKNNKSGEVLIDGPSLCKDFDTTIVNNVVDNFIKDCDDANGKATTINLDPLFGYIPLSPTANIIQRPLEKKVSNNAIGKLSLETYNDSSIRKAFYGLLEARKKIRKSIIDPSKIPNSNKFVDGILTDPKAYTGLTEVPGEVRSLYDNVTSRTIVELAIVMHEFFQSELIKFAIKNPKFTFDQFISNTPLDAKGSYILTNQPTGLASPVSKPADPLPGPGGYTIANIKKINTPQSKELITELEDFATYISEGEPSNKLGGAVSIAKALSFGVQNMGT